MPELPEVQTVVTTLRPHVIGAKIVAVDLRRADVLDPPQTDLPAVLVGRKITSIDRRGKRIIFTLDDSNRFFIHLGMSGRLTINQPGDVLAKHTHLICELSNESTGSRFQIRFVDPRRFGGIWWLANAPCDAGMGPEPLTMPPKLLAKLLSRTTRSIKNALLDQTVVAGLGNIYVDESLFAAGIHPLTPANKLTAKQIAGLNRSIKAILRRAIRHRGSTLRDYRDAQGESGGFQLRHRVYAREDKPCVTCKTLIERIVIGGRSTHFCPRCQPEA